MVDYLVTPNKISGKFSVPPSKSQTLRSILFASFARGESVIENPLQSPDCDAMITACRSFGAKIILENSQIHIIGTGGRVPDSKTLIDAGNSGIVSRFITAIAGLSSGTITGDASLQNLRSIQPLCQALTELGVSVQTNGFLPVKVKGPWVFEKCSVHGEDSQHLSALLIASAISGRKLTVDVKKPGEKPWIDLTCKWLDFLEVPYSREGYQQFILPGGKFYSGFTYNVPTDLSSLAFPVAAALITRSTIELYGIDFDYSQGDLKLFEVFREMGANISQYAVSCSHLRGVTVDVNDFIDAVPVLAAVACFAEGKTIIKNALVARNKECDRLSCITAELKKMGAKIEETTDSLIIEGVPLKGAKLYSYKDHRMGMALAVAALGAKGTSKIYDTDCVKKTFPGFADLIPGIVEV